MRENFSARYPDWESMLALEPEEFAGFLLEYLLSEEAGGQKLNRRSYSLSNSVMHYPQPAQERMLKAMMEAWSWLEREGMVAPAPGEDTSWAFVTRRGKAAANPDALNAYRHASLLPKRQLHPRLVNKVWASFLRGDYDTAIFQAFKEVEVAVREAAGMTNEQIGVQLMRQAFSKADAPLADPTAIDAERDALGHLFAGAIGVFKNPGSHRYVDVAEPEAAVEAIMLASHLLRIVDARNPAGA